MRKEKYPTAKVPIRLLSWFCPDHLDEEIEGDLLQKFEKDVNLFGERKAKKRLVWSAMLIALKGRNTPRQGEALFC